jgi:hypothetical protein
MYCFLVSYITDYPKIVKLLSGEVVKCDENYRRIVNLFATMVINEIQPLELILSLRKYNVLTALEAEETVKDEQNYGKTRAAWYIITNIHRHVEDWFKYFLTSLIENSCEHLAQILDDDMVQSKLSLFCMKLKINEFVRLFTVSIRTF